MIGFNSVRSNIGEKIGVVVLGVVSATLIGAGAALAITATVTAVALAILFGAGALTTSVTVFGSYRWHHTHQVFAIVRHLSEAHDKTKEAHEKTIEEHATTRDELTRLTERLEQLQAKAHRAETALLDYQEKHKGAVAEIQAKSSLLAQTQAQHQELLKAHESKERANQAIINTLTGQKAAVDKAHQESVKRVRELEGKMAAAHDAETKLAQQTKDLQEMAKAASARADNARDTALAKLLAEQAIKAAEPANKAAHRATVATQKEARALAEVEIEKLGKEVNALGASCDSVVQKFGTILLAQKFINKEFPQLEKDLKLKRYESSRTVMAEKLKLLHAEIDGLAANMFQMTHYFATLFDKDKMARDAVEKVEDETYKQNALNRIDELMNQNRRHRNHYQGEVNTSLPEWGPDFQRKIYVALAGQYAAVKDNAEFARRLNIIQSSLNDATQRMNGFYESRIKILISYNERLRAGQKDKESDVKAKMQAACDYFSSEIDRMRKELTQAQAPVHPPLAMTRPGSHAPGAAAAAAAAAAAVPTSPRAKHGETAMSPPQASGRGATPPPPPTLTLSLSAMAKQSPPPAAGASATTPANATTPSAAALAKGVTPPAPTAATPSASQAQAKGVTPSTSTNTTPAHSRHTSAVPTSAATELAATAGGKSRSRAPSPASAR